MDGAWHPIGHRLVRTRWRLRGAWMWPAFAVLGIADGFIGHALPIDGDSQSVWGGVVVALVLNLLCVAVLARPLGAALRLRRRDLPAAIARNYAGTALVVLVTAGFVTIGALHGPAIRSDRAAMRDAAARAAAYIGDRAPAPFRAHASRLSTFTIQAGSVYRACAANDDDSREYCVIVSETAPAASSVRPDGSEPNSVMSLGAG